MGWLWLLLDCDPVDDDGRFEAREKLPVFVRETNFHRPHVARNVDVRHRLAEGDVHRRVLQHVQALDQAVVGIQ